MNPTDTPTQPQSLPTAPNAETAAPALPLTDDDLAILATAIPEKGKALARDTLAFWRELPRLLADGEEGRFALIHDGTIVSLWDSLNDAVEAGYAQFGDDRFATTSIKQLELLRIRQYLAQQRAKQCQK